jgi:hypothetical protein
MATVYHNTTGINGMELKNRLAKCEGQNDQFKELFIIYHQMTKWEARRRFQEHFGEIDEIQPGRAINTLMEQGIVYKSTEKWREERGALNFVYKLYPTDGSVPEDFNNNVEKIIVPLQFNEDGTINGELTTELFIDKLIKAETKYKF